MLDPFSTFASALQIAEVASGVGCRIIRFIRDLKEVDGTTEELFKKLEHLGMIVETIEKLMKRRNSQSSRPVAEEEARTLSTMESLLKCCGKDIDGFTKILTPLKHSGGGNGLHRVSTQARLDWNERHLCKLEKSVHGNIMLLQTLSSCSEVVIQEDAMFRLAGNNDSIVRNLDKVQLDVAKLRSAFEKFSHENSQKTNTLSDTLTRVESPDEISGEESIERRMRDAIEVTESLYDKVSSLGSLAGDNSEPVAPRRASWNASTVEEEAEYRNFPLAKGHGDATDGPESNTGTPGGEVDGPSRPHLQEFLSTDHDQHANTLMQTTSLNALPLAVMDRLLENYQFQATKDLEVTPPRYEEAERNLLRSLDSGATREHAHKIPFKERFDVGIKLAKAQVGQRKYAVAQATLESMRCLVGQNQKKIGRWSCAFAQLYQYWYSEAPDWRLLSKLEEFSTQSYNVAFASASSASMREQSLNDSAGALIALYTWTGDKVAVETLRTLHPSVCVATSLVAIQDVPDSPQAESDLVPSLSRGTSSEMSRASIVERSVPRVNVGEASPEDLRLSADANSTLLLLAAKSKSVELVQYHIKRADVNSRDRRQRSPLHLALLGPGGKEVVPILLEHGADVNATDGFGTSPLHICSDLDKDDIARELIQKGAELNTVDSASETPLHIAVRKRRLRMVECLLSAGAMVGDICRHSGSKEIDFVIREHLDSLSPSRSESVVSRFLRRS